MFQKILVAMDRSSTAQAVFDRAVILAQAMNAHLMLLHVLSADDLGGAGVPMYPYISFFPPIDDTAWDAYRKQWDTFEKEGLKRLQDYTKQATKEGIKTEFTQTGGMPGPIISKLAKTWNADLILMGSHGRKGLHELFLGSVSNYVMHHAPCSVLIVHPREQSNFQSNQAQQGEFASLH
ncbi:MAG: universal stress protein [Leptolyngbyaceae cyanobacterium MO_188.B28]|nr:universal stress protein [Leptolyngbyaceae cyanobacterium MO_188.B28]